MTAALIDGRALAKDIRARLKEARMSLGDRPVRLSEISQWSLQIFK